jgi:hypothetical protein
VSILIFFLFFPSSDVLPTNQRSLFRDSDADSEEEGDFSGEGDEFDVDADEYVCPLCIPPPFPSLPSTGDMY